MSQDRKALNLLLNSPVTDSVISHLIKRTVGLFPKRSAPKTRQRWNDIQRLPKLKQFVNKVVRFSNATTPTLLMTSCYLSKLGKILPQDSVCLPSTFHRLFLSCLIISFKFNNDSCPTFKDWVEYTDNLFTLEDLSVMERQMLQIFDYNLKVSESFMQTDLYLLVEPIKQDIEISYFHRMKMGLITKNNNISSYEDKEDGYHFNREGRVDSNNSFQMYDLKRNMSNDSDLSSITIGNNNFSNSIHEIQLTPTRSDIWYDEMRDPFFFSG